MNKEVELKTQELKMNEIEAEKNNLIKKDKENLMKIEDLEKVLA